VDEDDVTFDVQVSCLEKSYGELKALSGVTFSVRRGEIFGYLGPNGAGKTTTINILSALLARDAGEVRVCGADIDLEPIAVKRLIGVVPEESNLYPELTCRRNLEYLGELYGLSRASKRTRANELLDTFDLGRKADAPFRSLSRGMKRRLTIAAALVHSPRVIFLDEPTAGLDVPSARALRSLIRDINRNGATVFLTTHNLAEAESLCDRVLILVKGRTVAEGAAADIAGRVVKAHTLSVLLSGDVKAHELCQACPAVKAASFVDGAWRLELTDTHATLTQLTAFAQQRDVRILGITSAAANLEDAFMAIIERDADQPEPKR